MDERRGHTSATPAQMRRRSSSISALPGRGSWFARPGGCCRQAADSGETRMTRAECALAAGFGRSPPSHETFHDLFRARRERAACAGPTLQAGSSLAGHRGDTMLAALYGRPMTGRRCCPIQGPHHRRHRGVGARTYGAQSPMATTQHRRDPATKRPAATWRFGVAGARHLALARRFLPRDQARVRRVFRCRPPTIEAIGAHLSRPVPGAAWWWRKRRGCACARRLDGFELAVSAVVGQQVNRGRGAPGSPAGLVTLCGATLGRRGRPPAPENPPAPSRRRSG